MVMYEFIEGLDSGATSSQRTNVDQGESLNPLLFVLGADDPEMRRIRDLLSQNDHQFIDAIHSGEPVHPGNAYSANNSPANLLGHRAVFVECEVVGIDPYRRIDHHRRGDPGYGMDAKHYLKASSLGQLLTMLEVEPTQSDRVLAAMDHCFEDALSGDCPGVSPEEVLDMKVGLIASSHNTTTFEVLQKIAEFESVIQSAGEILVGNYTVKNLTELNLGAGYTLEDLCMGVAQAKTRAIVIMKESDPDGRVKITIDGAPDDLVEYFMNEYSSDNGLVDVYGVPTRGYAGGYIQ